MATNAAGHSCEKDCYPEIKARVGHYVDIHPMLTCLRNRAVLEEIKARKGSDLHAHAERARYPREGGARVRGFPRYDDWPGGRLGFAEYRSKRKILGADYHIGADGLHQLQPAWEPQHRIVTGESVSRHTLFRQ
jgi:hypothetical protein